VAKMRELQSDYVGKLEISSEEVVVRKKVLGDVHIGAGGTLRLHGMVVGDVTISSGGKLFLHGMAVGNVNVEAEAYATILGMVNGVVRNNGGKLEVHGMVNGNLHTFSGNTYIDPEAVINP